MLFIFFTLFLSGDIAPKIEKKNRIIIEIQTKLNNKEKFFFADYILRGFFQEILSCVS